MTDRFRIDRPIELVSNVLDVVPRERANGLASDYRRDPLCPYADSDLPVRFSALFRHDVARKPIIGAFQVVRLAPIRCEKARALSLLARSFPCASSSA